MSLGPERGHESSLRTIGRKGSWTYLAQCAIYDPTRCPPQRPPKSLARDGRWLSSFSWHGLQGPPQTADAAHCSWLVLCTYTRRDRPRNRFSEGQRGQRCQRCRRMPKDAEGGKGMKRVSQLRDQPPGKPMAAQSRDSRLRVSNRVPATLPHLPRTSCERVV